MKEVKSHKDVFDVTRSSLRTSLRSIAANIKSRKTLTGRQRRRALLIVDELRFDIEDSFCCIPVKTAEGSWKGSEMAVGHLLKCIYAHYEVSSRTKFAKAIGNYISDKLESVLEDSSYAEELRRNRYGIQWLGSHWSNDRDYN
jgi:hypothetical protein